MSFRVVYAVRLGIPAVAAQPPFPSLVVERLGVCLDMDERPGSDGLKTRQIRLLAEECLVRGCHVKRRVRCQVCKVGGSPHQLSPKKLR